MRQAKMTQKMIIEKMAERSVADVVQESRETNQAFDISGRRDRFRPTSLDQRWIEASDRPAAQMHGAQDMLKARVLGTGVHPPGALQLMNSPQALNPGMIDERLLGRLLAVAGGGEGNVTVQRIADQTFGTEIVTCHWSVFPYPLTKYHSVTHWHYGNGSPQMTSAK